MITITDNCINLIKKFEGLKLEPYHGKADKPTVFTIGYGTIRYPPDYLRGKSVEMTDPYITEAQAFNFLKWEVTLNSQSVDPYLRDDLTANQYGALISFAYNLGVQALRDSTLRKKVNDNPKDTSIREEFAKWVHSNGAVVDGLITRRKAEADMYFTP